MIISIFTIILISRINMVPGDPLLLNNINWLGFDDLKSTGNYQWVDGSKGTYTYWAPGEPNNHANREHCGEVRV